MGDAVPSPGQHAHPSFSTYVYGAAGSGAIAVDPPPPTHDVRLFGSQWYQWSPVLTVNVHEMQRVRKLLCKVAEGRQIVTGEMDLECRKSLTKLGHHLESTAVAG